MAIHHALNYEIHHSDLELLVELICKKIMFQDTIKTKLRLIIIYKAVKE